MLDHLADAYGLEGGDTESLSNALMAVASYMAEENLEEAMEGLQYEIEDSFLYGLDEDSIRVMFRELYSNSAFYILSRRCGIDPMEYLEEEHFFGITDFNRLSVLSFLGNAVSQLVEPILMDIGKTIRKIQMEEQEKTVADQNYIGYNEFNTLIRKSKSKGEIEHGTDLSQKGRLSVSEPDNQRGDSGNLTVEEEEVTIGKYGMLRKTFLKEHRKNWYQSMMLTGKLENHLAQTEKAAQERMEVLMKGLLERYPAPEKESDPMAWTAHMNSLTAMAEESILTELVYS